MPKRTDLRSILIIGSGPIVIGQACEFDYSGTQACRALKEEGYRVILVNSNPATIMTDPDLVDATYIEPMTVEALEAVIARERPDALLPTMGGQTALNLTIALEKEGVLKKYGVRLIGANIEAINKAEDREQFRKAMEKLGIAMPKSAIARSVAEAQAIVARQGLPAIIRPSFTLGGTGGGISRTLEELERQVELALTASPIHEVLIEESVLGWKEYELEVMRDTRDNVVIICSIENVDPMGLHTGDSITVAPAQTLTDREYQHLRDLSIAVIREIGVDTGGSNIQFAVNPRNGDVVVIEMNPRVSRSSALASKATGFPIAKIAAKLAVGYTLDELPNDITRMTPASFEPTIDYVVTKVPRFTFEKFPMTDPHLTTQMKSVGEAMAIGRVFRESLQKALRSMETGLSGLDELGYGPLSPAEWERFVADRLARPTADRLLVLADAMRAGWSDERLYGLTAIDPWFLAQIRSLVEEERRIRQVALPALEAADLRRWKQWGFADRRIARLMGAPEEAIRAARLRLGVRPVYKKVDTCAAEFEAATPYFYSTYEDESESLPTGRRKVVILGSGPNRIGQGIEFDYCCVHASMALRAAGWESIMINCNPETVSTDYDISDRLYFEPITFEDVMEVLDRERPAGVIVQLGGQTPLKLARQLEEAGVRLLGTPYDSIDRSEDRRRFAELVTKLGLNQPEHGTAHSLEEARAIGRRLGYPILVRPSYVLGGRAMEVVRSEAQLAELFAEALRAAPEHPVLVDKFLGGAIEVDVDVLADGRQAVMAGMMEHIELAGIHSGDSACSLPPYSLEPAIQEEIRRQSFALALELGVVGLMNAQFAVKDGRVYLIEVNPRASRTVPFVSKAMGVPVAKLATRLMLGERLADLPFDGRPLVPFAVKEVVFPFAKFPGSDLTLGPEMLSTGEVMGRGATFAEAYLKSQIAASNGLRHGGFVFLGVVDGDKAAVVPIAGSLQRLGFKLLATPGTRRALMEAGLADVTETRFHMGEPGSLTPGSLIQYMLDDTLALVINTTTHARRQRIDHSHARRLILTYNIPYCTTVEAARALVLALQTTKGQRFQYAPLRPSPPPGAASA
ncbi:MAG: carbamoyl-phosphate synthase large subunit [Candidatus Lambdaproteobacteria bacterium]|nr:carbamoyl-phosphate synthase large subunit [Candidatus Lambdaproteobacteria bacterium]